MGFIIVKSKVKDFDKWKKAFLDGKDDRKQASFKNFRIFTNIENKNEVTMLGEFESLEKCKAMMESDELKQKMQESGTIGPPEVYVLDHAFDEKI